MRPKRKTPEEKKADALQKAEAAKIKAEKELVKAKEALDELKVDSDLENDDSESGKNGNGYSSTISHVLMF